ncbi:hypothetical protein GW17_00060538 [Ensete ventricosum]|nr:hypothetical protein GW17_00060538 [Ensete ventricosum]
MIAEVTADMAREPWSADVARLIGRVYMVGLDRWAQYLPYLSLSPPPAPRGSAQWSFSRRSSGEDFIIRMDVPHDQSWPRGALSSLRRWRMRFCYVVVFVMYVAPNCHVSQLRTSGEISHLTPQLSQHTL